VTADKTRHCHSGDRVRQCGRDPEPEVGPTPPVRTALGAAGVCCSTSARYWQARRGTVPIVDDDKPCSTPPPTIGPSPYGRRCGLRPKLALRRGDPTGAVPSRTSCRTSTQ
jgi:hypothetical protein